LPGDARHMIRLIEVLGIEVLRRQQDDEKNGRLHRHRENREKRIDPYSFPAVSMPE